MKFIFTMSMIETYDFEVENRDKKRISLSANTIDHNETVIFRISRKVNIDDMKARLFEIIPMFKIREFETMEKFAEEFCEVVGNMSYFFD